MAETIDAPLGRSRLTLDRPYESTLDRQAGALRVHGAVDELAAHTFRDDLLGSLEAGGSLTVDLRDVDLFPSVAIGALVAGIRQASANGGTLEVLVAAESVPQRVLSICRLPYRLA